MRHVVAVCVVTGCTATGALDLQLSMPGSADLAPQGMTTITVLAQSPSMDLANTAVITGSAFTAGDFPAGSGVDLEVLMYDDSTRLVGVGEASQPITISAQSTTSVSMPVRRPFVYAADGTTLYTFDPTQSPLQQGVLPGVQMPQLAVSVGGDLLAVASTNTIQAVDTGTDRLSGSPIALGATVHDVAPVPGTHKVAVAHDAGISVVDLDTRQVNVMKGPAVDRVTVGLGSNGGYVAWGLVGAATVPAGPLDACSGSSSLVYASIGSNNTGLQQMALSDPVAAIAAGPTTTSVYAALPCANEIAEVSTGSANAMTSLSRAAVVAVSGDQVFAAGSQPSIPACIDSTSNPTPCTPNAKASCPQQATPSDVIAYAMTGASLVIKSFPIRMGSAATSLALPEQQETMLDPDDNAGQFAEVLHTMSLAPLDLVVLPGQQYLALLTTNSYYTIEIGDNAGNLLIPCLSATTSNWILLDMAAASVAQRIRTNCNLTVGPDPTAQFPSWVCATPTGETPTIGSTYAPTSVGALFGAR
jgi:hypothetical protein